MFILIALILCVAIAYLVFLFWLGMKIGDKIVGYGSAGFVIFMSTIVLGVGAALQIIQQVFP